MANKFSKTVSAGTRVYYFDVRTDKQGNDYLTITEMNTRNEIRNCLFVHPENIGSFLAGLQEAAANVNKR